MYMYLYMLSPSNWVYVRLKTLLSPCLVYIFYNDYEIVLRSLLLSLNDQRFIIADTNNIYVNIIYLFLVLYTFSFCYIGSHENQKTEIIKWICKTSIVELMLIMSCNSKRTTLESSLLNIRICPCVQLIWKIKLLSC